MKSKLLKFCLILPAALLMNSLFFFAILALNQSKRETRPQWHSTNLRVIHSGQRRVSAMQKDQKENNSATILEFPVTLDLDLPQPQFETIHLDNLITPLPAAPQINEPLRAIYAPQPSYPNQALKKMGVEVVVTIELLINERGRVKKIKPLSTTTDQLFYQAVERAVKQWRFTEPKQQGKPVKVRARKTFYFRIKP